MLRIYDCIVTEHDLRLVALAGVICGMASLTAVNLLQHVRRSGGIMRKVWLSVAAAASGFGIWATHFIAMLAFSPGIPSAYNVFLTVLSLVAAIAITGVGLGTASVGSRAMAWVGGGMVGGGIAAMHYTGMAAFEIAGRIIWNPALVALSIALGAMLAGVALRVTAQRTSGKAVLYSGVLLALAILSHHFTAMAAASIQLDPMIAVSEMAIPTRWLAVAVAAASVLILILTFAGLWLEIRARRRDELEQSRMRSLVDAAVEGLVVCDGPTIVTANRSFGALVGISPESVKGRDVAEFLPDAGRGPSAGDLRTAAEAILRHMDGGRVPVETIERPVEFAGKMHRAIAVRDLRDRKRAEDRIQFLAHHDALTGLPNRNSFGERLDEEIRSHQVTGCRLAVLCLDLDRFKEVNDLFGHAAGDHLLQRFASCVRSVLAEPQMMARLGGDEFAIVAPDLREPAQAGQLAEAVLKAVAHESSGAAASGLLSTSIGIAVYPDDSTDRTSLLNHADMALYRAKADGRGTYRFFEEAMGARVRERRLLEHDLRHAIARGELSLAYQPQCHVDSQEVTGFEVLLRWMHPKRGAVSPAAFIPIAEETSLIIQIGEWVLRTACMEAASWQRQLSLAVNVSAVQLHNPGFAHLVHEVLCQTGLSPHRLELEITETALIRNRDLALTALRRLKALGVRIAMDDFGTGYSSLSNLRAFPFDKIKVDGSFVHLVDGNPEAAAIVRAVLGLGRGLGLPVLAEGVETLGELQFLRSEHCNGAQGYLLGRPLPIEAYRALTHGSEGDRFVTPVEERVEASAGLEWQQAIREPLRVVR